MFKVIAVVGPLNSGKNAFAKHIVNKAQYTPMAFADPIKIILRDLFPELTVEELWGPSSKRTDIARELLQTFGTDFARKYDPYVWVNKMTDRIDHCRKTGSDLCFPYGKGVQGRTGVIITDARYPNEIQTLRTRYDTIVVRLVRASQSTEGTPKHRSHESETSHLRIPENWVDFIIHNNKTLEALYSEADRLLESVAIKVP